VRSLGLFGLVAITFASVAGGPYGFEDAVGAGGFTYTLFGLLAMPLLWQMPLALMTAELACMMPENGGHILWVDRAFGRFWSYQNSYWTLASFIFEGALFPVLFMDYFSAATGWQLSSVERGCLGTAVLLLCFCVNVYGPSMVANSSVVFSVAGLSPFFLFCVLGVGRLWSSSEDGGLQSVLAEQPPEQRVRWGPFLTILLWNSAGYDMLGACAGDVKRPERNFPLSLCITLVATVLIDGLAILVGMTVVQDSSTWTDGTFEVVAGVLGGQPLVSYFTACAAISTLGLQCTLLMLAARVIQGMASMDSLPRVLATVHPRYHTPWVAMLALCGVMGLFMNVDFVHLAELEMWFYALSTVMKFAALAVLREKEPSAPRPFRVPVRSKLGMRVFCAVPVCCCLLMLARSNLHNHLIGLAGCTMSMLAALLHTLRAPQSRKGFIDFSALDDL
jgi:amino acid transporter